MPIIYLSIDIKFLFESGDLYNIYIYRRPIAYIFIKKATKNVFIVLGYFTIFLNRFIPSAALTFLRKNNYNK